MFHFNRWLSLFQKHISITNGKDTSGYPIYHMKEFTKYHEEHRNKQYE